MFFIKFGASCLLLTVMFSIVPELNAHEITWSNSGPYGGKIRALAVDPVDTSTVYAGAYGHGIFKSLDSGASWVEMSNGLPTWPNSTAGSPKEKIGSFGDYFPINVIWVNPLSPNNLLVGTGRGVYRSTNGGEEWIASTTGLPDSAEVAALVQMPADTSVFFAGTRALAYGIGMEDGGLFKSLDGGRNWSLIEDFPHWKSYYITTIAAHPDSEGVIYVGFNSAGEPDTTWGLWKSQDGGDTWGILVDDLTPYYLCIDPVNGQRMYTVMYTGYMQSWLYTSTDGGYSWTLVFDPYSWETRIVCLNGYANPTVLFAWTDGGRLISSDQGNTWTNALDGIAMDYYGFWDLAANPLDPEVIYVGNNLGVYRSNDGGVTVDLNVEGMTNTYIKDVAVHPIDCNVVYAAGEVGGVWKSVNGGETWDMKNKGASYGEENAIAIDPQYPDTLYRGGDCIHRSYDGGQNWEKIAGGYVTSIAVRPDSTNIIFWAPYPSTLLKSNDRGQTWKTVFSAAPNTERINAVIFNPKRPRVAYLGTGHNLLDHGLYKTIDGGESWVQISDPGEILSMAINLVYPETLYVGIRRSGLKRSTDGGLTFSPINDGLFSQRITDLVIDPQCPAIIYASTGDQGVFKSTNGGDQWTPLDGGLGDPRVRSLALSASNSDIMYVGTYGRGVWKAQGLLTSVESTQPANIIPEEYKLNYAYPNPFNTSIMITYSMPEESIVSLKIVNIQGQLVKRLKSSLHLPGKHHAQWDGLNESGVSVASGIYFIVLQAGEYLQGQKVVLLR